MAPGSYQAGFVGKVPAQADFLKVQTGAPAAQALHRWLEDSNETLSRGAHKLPSQPLSFALAAPDSTLVGVLAPGRDKVGRTFPTAVFVAGGGRAELPFIPETFAPFLRAATGLLESVETLDAAEVGRRVIALPLPIDADAARAREDARRRLASPHQGNLQRLCEKTGATGSHYYAARTFLAACDAERRNEPGRGGLVLDCPCAADLDVGVSFWMDLYARRHPRWGQISMLWTPDRALLGFGAPHGSWLSFVVKADHPSMKRWPLVTQQLSAAEAARVALNPSARAALDRQEASWEELLSALAAG